MASRHLKRSRAFGRRHLRRRHVLGDPRRVRPRLLGILLLALGAAALPVVGRFVPAAPPRLGSILSWSAGLAAFALAMMGVLLTLYGDEIRQRWAGGHVRPPSDRGRDRPDVRSPVPAECDPLLACDGGMGCGRLALTTVLVLRAQQAGERRRTGIVRPSSSALEPHRDPN